MVFGLPNLAHPSSRRFPSSFCLSPGRLSWLSRLLENVNKKRRRRGEGEREGRQREGGEAEGSSPLSSQERSVTLPFLPVERNGRGRERETVKSNMQRNVSNSRWDRKTWHVLLLAEKTARINIDVVNYLLYVYASSDSPPPLLTGEESQREREREREKRQLTS